MASRMRRPPVVQGLPRLQPPPSPSLSPDDIRILARQEADRRIDEMLPAARTLSQEDVERIVRAEIKQNLPAVSVSQIPAQASLRRGPGLNKFRRVVAETGELDPADADIHSDAADNASPLQALINRAGSRAINLGGRTYKCSSYLSLPSGTRIKNGTLDFRGMSRPNDTTNYVLRGIGTISASVPLADDVTADGIYPHLLPITAANIQALGGLTNDDMLFVSSSRLWDSNYGVGELVLVRESPTDSGSTLDPDTVQLYAPFLYDYAVSDTAIVKKITPVRDVHLKDLEIIGGVPMGILAQSFQGGINFRYARDIVIEDCRLKHVNIDNIRLTHCLNAKVRGGELRDSPTWYGIDVSGASRNILIDGVRMFNIRHAVTASSSSAFGGGCVNFLTVTNCYAEGREATFDTHPGVDRSTWTNNQAVCSGDPTEQPGGSPTDVATYGFIMQGRNTILKGNRVKGNAGQGIFIQSLVNDTIAPFSCIVEGNEIEADDVPDSSSYGISLQINSDTVVSPDRLSISGNTVKGPFEFGVYVNAPHGGAGALAGAMVNDNIVVGATEVCIAFNAGGGDLNGVSCSGNILTPADKTGVGIAYIATSPWGIKRAVAAGNIVNDVDPDAPPHTSIGIRKSGTGTADVAISDLQTNCTTPVQWAAIAGDWYSINGKAAPKNLTSADSPYTAALRDGLILCDCTGGNITVNLLDPLVGARHEIKKVDSGANTVTVDPSGSQKIDNSTTKVISDYTPLRIIPTAALNGWLTL